jgi:predicted alpha/beta superfamily hydrolase
VNVVEKYSIPEVSGQVTRVTFGTRVVEFWGGGRDCDKLLIAHDGQCIFDTRTAKKNTTWRLAEHASLIAKEFDSPPPLIVAIWHQGEVGDSVSRGLDLSPEDYFKSGMNLYPKNGPFDVSAVEGNKYLKEIFEIFVPAILEATQTRTTPEKSAMIGASRGALSTLYALSKYPHKFHTALAHSTHWPIGRNPLVKMTIENLPSSGQHQIWMSHGSEGFDAEYGPFQDYAHELLEERGYRHNKDFYFTFYPGAAHTEAAWAIQSVDSLRNWFQKTT